MALRHLDAYKGQPLPPQPCDTPGIALPSPARPPCAKPESQGRARTAVR